jgi:hypothetical protein
MPKRQNATTGSRRIIDEYGIEVIPLKASYVANAGRRVLIADGDESCGVEEYACRHFNRLGYSTTLLENRPIHVLFATYMWPVVQDASDRRSRIVGFPDRAAYDARIKCKLIWTRLPADFGKPEYAARRVKHIKQHIAGLTAERLEMQRVFDRWLGPSSDLRNYLWAHRAEHIQVARQLIDVMPVDTLVEVLRYLIEHYWGRYAGWPDLLVHRDNEFMLVEVKSAEDKLRAAQLKWMRGNHERLHLPFKLVEIAPQLFVRSGLVSRPDSMHEIA